MRTLVPGHLSSHSVPGAYPGGGRWDLCAQIYDYDVTNENKHVGIEINEQTSHGCKFCSVGADLPKLI